MGRFRAPELEQCANDGFKHLENNRCKQAAYDLFKVLLHLAPFRAINMANVKVVRNIAFIESAGFHTVLT